MAGPPIYIKYKCKGGETIEDVAKLHKIKDWQPILKMPENKKAAQAHKQKVSFAKGLVITLPNPKVKWIEYKGPNGKAYMTEADWKEAKNKLHDAMSKAYRKLYLAWDMAETRYQGQKKVNKEFPVVTFLCSNWVGDTGDEPIKSRNASMNALNKFAAVVKGAKYKDFEKQMRATEKAVNLYRKECVEWQDQLIGSAGNWATGLTITKEVSFVVFSAAATTVALPAAAGYGVVMATGAGVGAGTAFLKSGANEVGRKIAGYDVTLKGSATKIGKDMMWGAVFGAGGAGATKWVIGKFGPAFASKLAEKGMAQRGAMMLFSGKVSSPIARRLLGRFQGKWVSQAVGEVLKKAGVTVPDKTMGILMSEVNKQLMPIAVDNASKFMIRIMMGSGVGIIKNFTITDFKKGPVADSIRRLGNSSKKQVDEKKLADMVVKDLKNDPMVYAVYEEAIRREEAKIAAAIEADLMKLIQDLVKKHAK